MQVLEDIVLCETSILRSVQSSTCLKRFTFSFRAKFIEDFDQLYFSKLVHVSHLQFLVSSIWGAAVEKGSWKSRLSLGRAFPRWFFALWLQALDSDTLLLPFFSHLVCLFACDVTRDAQRRGCRRKFTTALRAVSLGYWRQSEDQVQYCKCLAAVPSTQPRIFRHTAGMDAFFSILLQLQNELFFIMYGTGVPKTCLLPACIFLSLPCISGPLTYCFTLENSQTTPVALCFCCFFPCFPFMMLNIVFSSCFWVKMSIGKALV